MTSAARKLQSQAKIKLVIGQGPYAGQEFEFSQDSIFIGRAAENDLVLADDAKVSRKHAEIKKTDLGYEILNLSEKNNVYVNGEVRPRWLLKSGERVVLGQTDFTFFALSDAEDASEKTSVPQPSVVRLTPLTKTEQTGKSAHHPPLPQEVQNLSQVSFPHKTQAIPQANFPQSPLPPAGQNPLPLAAQNPGGQGHTSWSMAPMQQPGFQGSSPPPPGGSYSTYRGGAPEPSSPVMKIGLIIVILGVIGWFYLNQNQAKKKESADLYRTFEKVQQDIQRSEQNLNAYKERKEKLDSSQYRRAQEHLVKGLRDYRQGQFARSRDSFRLVLNLDPENEVARRYYQLSSIKFDEMVKFHMRQGMSYRDKNNFRLCKASYANAMKMINNPTDSTYKEAEQFFRECDLAQLGRF